jgi:hypothetical protein
MTDSDPFCTIADALEQLHQALGRFEADSALLEPTLIPSFVALISGTAGRLREQVESDSSVDIQAFSRLLPEWLDAWRLSRSKMNELCAEQLGYCLPAGSSVKAENWWKRRLLARLLQTKEPAAILGLVESIKRDDNPARSSETSLVEEPEVNAALKTWGQMTLEEFVAAFPGYSKSIVQEASKQRGLKAKVTTKAGQKRLHEEAKRFYQNTELG